MIENCITDKTNPIIIKTDKLIEFNVDNAKEYEKLARRISEETGVPKGYIFTAPYYFFIDHWYKIGNEWYFYKSDGYDFHFINELLGEIISKYFDLDTVHYNVAKLCVKGKKEESLIGLLMDSEQFEKFCFFGEKKGPLRSVLWIVLLLLLSLSYSLHHCPIDWKKHILLQPTSAFPASRSHKLVPTSGPLHLPFPSLDLPSPDLPTADSSSSFGSPLKGGEVHPDHPIRSLSVVLCCFLSP